MNIKGQKYIDLFTMGNLGKMYFGKLKLLMLRHIRKLKSKTSQLQHTNSCANNIQRYTMYAHHINRHAPLTKNPGSSPSVWPLDHIFVLVWVWCLYFGPLHKILSLKLTASLPLKINSWFKWVSSWCPSCRRQLLVFGRISRCWAKVLLLPLHLRQKL